MLPSNYFILCCSLLLLPSVFPRIWVFPNEPALLIFQENIFLKCIYFNKLDHTIRKRSESDNKLMNIGCSIVWPTCSFVCFLLLLQLLFVLPVHPFQKRINQQSDILENILYTLIFSDHLIHL